MLGLFACSDKNADEADRLNSKAYAFHYRSLDSTAVYAQRAFDVSEDYADGRAEALNNLAFVHISKMEFEKASKLLNDVQNITDNQVELLVADVQMMRLCQRQSRNKDFYNYRESALRRLKRIKEEAHNLSPRLRKRMIYAETELYIVASVYFYYIGLPERAVIEQENIEPNGDIQQDTAQWLSYMYNVGAGGLISAPTKEAICQQEFEFLFRCYGLAMQSHYSYWEANSLQAISEHLIDKRQRRQLVRDNTTAITILNTDEMPDSLLAGNLAQRALVIFSSYGDVYQTAGAYRTLASCYWALRDYKSALFCLQNALHRNPVIKKAPDLVSSICEQLSLVYSAMNVKSQSDVNRNVYLDIQRQTRQDKQQEARAEQLENSSKQLNMMLVYVGVAILVVILLLYLFNSMRARQAAKYSPEKMLEPLRQWEKTNARHVEEQNDRYEELHEEQEIGKRHVVLNKKKNIEQRAKVSLVNSVAPFIDRMRHEIHRLNAVEEPEEIRQERLDYVKELTDKIKEYNAILTQWIQMRQGELSLHVESVALQPLFDIVGKSRMGFERKGVSLVVEPTAEVVKADRTLTLFMINTLIDNARKFTETNDSVTLSARVVEEGYVDIVIADTGVGMTEEERAHLFERKVINSSSVDVQTSHGFGLLNCKGIIDKYKKVSKIFNGCSISVESEKGKGSVFSFRLPRVVRTLLAVVAMGACLEAHATATTDSGHGNRSKILDRISGNTLEGKLLKRANAYADSAYFANVNGRYAKALQYADSCIGKLNAVYSQRNPQGKDLMVLYSQSVDKPAEIQWFNDGLKTNFSIILDIRNESAIAALALHQWELYRYNNEVYTRLFKARSADNTLDAYVVGMQQSKANKTISIVVLILLLLLIIPAYYVLFYRHYVAYRIYVERVEDINKVLMNTDEAQAKLDAIARIIKSIDRHGGETVQFNSLNEVVSQISEVLQKSVAMEKAREENIEMAEDELHRVEIENDKLHVNNSVLDNCLSALKHETMYYPSRIRQLIENGGEDLHDMNELVDYYKELYMLLSAQAMRLVDDLRYQCRPVPLEKLLNALPHINKAEGEGWHILGDEDLLTYLFEILARLFEGRPVVLTAKDKGARYVVIDLELPNIVYTDEQCRDLFTPTTPNLQFYLCRQIVRDTGEFANARGCGVFAFNIENKTHIEITLPKTVQA
ncbi:ATPase/histidine kinase/DNA gyrase B/HSP90 domain protein [Prevotella sp. oral taxon 472 str. F0295]|jgi:hypothetical protein|nr:DUF5112 domain-containing protein [Prevotella sp. oral taxon 472]EEX52557.1 ATPase/histidine kinase/DNA gyrase B/HSP90 domain protein [Prevotella sp. oral taxon 472 str. F0295]